MIADRNARLGRTGLSPLDRFDEAKGVCDQVMCLEGYAPCHERYQQIAMNAIDSGVLHRLYTMHPSRTPTHGGVSVGLAKSELMKNTWLLYVKFRIETALQRTIK